MENLKGWKIDLKTVYGSGWKEREEFHLGEDLWESPDGNIACLLYRIVEVGVSKEVGHLAIFRNKERPEMIFNFWDLECWYLYESGVQFGNDGFLFVHRFKYSEQSFGIKVLAINLTANRFTIVDSLPEFWHKVNHVEGTKYRFVKTNYKGSIEETVIDLKNLKWQTFNNWSNFYPDSSLIEGLSRPLNFLFISPLMMISLISRTIRRVIHIIQTEKWQAIIAASIPFFLTLLFIFLGLYTDLFLPNYQDAGSPLGEKTHLNHWGRIFSYYTIPVIAVYTLWMWHLFIKRIKLPVAFWTLTIWTAGCFFIITIGFYEVFNVSLDNADAIVYKSRVIDKRIETTNSTTSEGVTIAYTSYVLTLPSWRPDRVHQKLSVKKKEYDKVLPNKSEVTLRIKPGYFSLPWIQSYEIHVYSPPQTNSHR